MPLPASPQPTPPKAGQPQHPSAPPQPPHLSPPASPQPALPPPLPTPPGHPSPPPSAPPGLAVPLFPPRIQTTPLHAQAGTVGTGVGGADGEGPDGAVARALLFHHNGLLTPGTDLVDGVMEYGHQEPVDGVPTGLALDPGLRMGRLGG